MNRLKIGFLTILSILIISGIIFYMHIETTYTVDTEISQFKDAILNRINNPTTVTNDIKIKKELTLDNC